jgi:hypothetical protein
MNHKAIVAGLRTEVEKINFEKYSLVSFRGMPVMKRAFFPGGNGLFDGESAARFPFNGTLILGSNFGAASKFVRVDGSLFVEDETSNTTWGPMRRLLDGAGLDLRECFFTNAWPCLHEGTSNTLGDLMKEWLANAALMRECSKAFSKTCADMTPSLIVALGPGPAAFVANTWPRELGRWTSNSIDGMDGMPLGTVQIDGAKHKTVCTAVVHPCYQHINAKHRKAPYQHGSGEVQLLKDADALRRSLFQEP